MGLGKYLAASLLAGAAFLYSPSLHAQDIQQNVAFNDSAAQARKTPGRNLEGRLSVSASREKNKLVLEISAKDCQIRTGFSEFYIGLPAESEITELKQTAKIKEMAQDGQGEEKWIDLYTVNELVEKGIFKAADYVADKVKVPVLTELLIDKVEKTKAARIQEWYKQMKKKGLFMEELSPDYPKMPSAHETTIARKYEITLDVEPTKVPEARMQICLQDQYERTVTINDITVKFDGKSQTQQAQQTAKPNVPAGLEKFLLDDSDLKLVKFWGPKEISAATKNTFQDYYLIKYEHSKISADITMLVLIMNKNESEKKAKECWFKPGKDWEKNEENPGGYFHYKREDTETYREAMPGRIVSDCIGNEEIYALRVKTRVASIRLYSTDYIISYCGYIPPETLDAWKQEADPNKREANQKKIAEFKNKLTRLRDSLKQKGEIKEPRILEEYFMDLQKYLFPVPERTGPMEHIHIH
jgi:hypothetical protein